jgi:hypothetical protein
MGFFEKLMAKAIGQDPQFFEGLQTRNAAAGDVPGIKRMKKGGSVKSSASKRADGCCKKGKTKGRMV